jgi:nitroreductase
MEHREITKAIIRSQHCQRNWDLSKEIPEEDLNLIVTAATQCPSKQNIAYYNLHVVTNRSVIEALHDQTKGFTISYNSPEKQTNSQVLANIVLVFEESGWANNKTVDQKFRNEESFSLVKQTADHSVIESLNKDKHMAVGVAAGYVNLTASLLGYATGCCACFDSHGIQQVLNLQKPPLLLMGIGYKNPLMNRRVHHNDHSFVFPTKEKQPIAVNYIA